MVAVLRPPSFRSSHSCRAAAWCATAKCSPAWGAFSSVSGPLEVRAKLLLLNGSAFHTFSGRMRGICLHLLKGRMILATLRATKAVVVDLCAAYQHKPLTYSLFPLVAASVLAKALHPQEQSNRVVWPCLRLRWASTDSTTLRPTTITQHALSFPHKVQNQKYDRRSGWQWGTVIPPTYSRSLAFCTTQVESRCLDLGRLQSVHMVSLRGSNMCELRGLWQLSKLQVLDLRDCWWLQSLDPAPATSLGSSGPAPELRRIDLTGCSQLRFLPAFVAQLPKLEQLVVKRCSQLLLPGSFNTQLYSSLAAGPLQRQAFISYSTHSEVAARFAVNALRPALEGAGVAVVLSGQVQQLQDKQQQQQLDQELKLQQWPAILADAAANSQVFVAVLDGHYSSSFSIVELDLAVRSHKLAGSQIRPAIVPVFLEAPGHVAPAEPAEVGKWSASEIGELQAEEVAKVWAAHLLAAEQQDSKILRTGAGLEEEGRLAEQVVHQVMQLASRPAQHGLVLGFEDQEEELAGKLQNSSLLGTWLYGQGGLGKTVMARLLVEQLEQRFSHHVFIPVDRQGGNQQLDALLANALSQLGCSSAAAGASSAAELLRDFVRTNDALLVLDNVWTKEQLIVLLPTELAPGSRVIVTSRYHPDELGLSQELGSKMDVRRLEPLAKEAAQTLLRHFTGMAEPPDGTVQLEQQILDACEGLPLALQLAGSFLWRETDVAAWKVRNAQACLMLLL
eukprot:GHUV01021657.1.p1 GENE.GHUV01021657.1~~GHUV01021657.1.p1  ORF type:complete len:732 (+),score=212.08 GHUV01021657.1:125-2320(+)